MTKLSTALLISSLVASTNAWSTSGPQEQSRRQAFANIMGTAFTAATVAGIVTGAPDNASAATAKTGAASPFTGFYDDPNHPDCLRQVKVVGAPLRGDGTRSAYPVMEVTGFDGKGSGATTCTEQPTRADLWKVEGSVRSTNDATIDFSAKGGPSKLAAKFEDGGIVFPDGNKWTKLSYVPKNRLPEDMTTLKSD